MSSWSWIKSVKLLPGFSGEDHDYFSFAQLHIVSFVFLIVFVFVYVFVFVFDCLLVLSCLHITLTTCLNGDKSLAVLYGSIVQQCLGWMDGWMDGWMGEGPRNQFYKAASAVSCVTWGQDPGSGNQLQRP